MAHKKLEYLYFTCFCEQLAPLIAVKHAHVELYLSKCCRCATLAFHMFAMYTCKDKSEMFHLVLDHHVDALIVCAIVAVF